MPSRAITKSSLIGIQYIAVYIYIYSVFVKICKNHCKTVLKHTTSYVTLSMLSSDIEILHELQTAAQAVRSSVKRRLYPAWIQIARPVSSQAATWFALWLGWWWPLGIGVQVPRRVSNFQRSWFNVQSKRPPWIQMAKLVPSQTATCWLRAEGPGAKILVQVKAEYFHKSLK